MKTLTQDALYWASFNRFEFRMPGECVMDCSASGSVDESVAYWTPKIIAQVEADNFPLKPTAESIRAELAEYGAWDAEELADELQNWRRLIWVAAGNISEDSEPDCSEPIQPSARAHE